MIELEIKCEVEMMELEKRHLIYDASFLTDIGGVRENNEDSLLLINNREINLHGIESLGIYLVADGMGGHQAGEVASNLAVETIFESISESLNKGTEPPIPNILIRQALQKANVDIYNMASSKPQFHAMGTTATLGLRLDQRLYIGHVGDSRAYLYRRGRIRQLTEDHSLVGRLLKEGIISQQEAKIHPDRNKIFRCLGVSKEVKVDIYQQARQDWLSILGGDSLIFCTDGLTSRVSDEELSQFLHHGDKAEVVCRDLVRLAKQKGSDDNISVILVRVLAEEELRFMHKQDSNITHKIDRGQIVC